MRLNMLAIFLLATASSLGVAQRIHPEQPQARTLVVSAAKIGSVPYAAKSHKTEGERIFKQQCARCHNAPDGFSSRISGTVLRHMRVRASLSKHEEVELMHFFNP